jgi:hypothetical protein
MSKGPWRAKPDWDVDKLIVTAEAKGYEVVSIEKLKNGVRLGLRRPGETTIETSRSLAKLA